MTGGVVYVLARGGRDALSPLVHPDAQVEALDADDVSRLHALLAEHHARTASAAAAALVAQPEALVVP
jgi:glutamate synthase domain-containing protein 3